MKLQTTRPKFVAVVLVLVAVTAGMSWTAQDQPAPQDKYTLRIPEGIAFDEFRGYEAWQVVSVSRPDELLNVIVANPAMIEAYQAGFPQNGKPWPDGAKAAKLQYKPKKNDAAPFNVLVPDVMKDVAFMVKDSKRFADSGGWGYGVFDYDAATSRFAPNGTGAKCGAMCHAAVKDRDFVFTSYAKR